ncbi:MAG: hypothetical protein GTO18_15355 [Anaerolineales bacterium]|nr:hypothetical protein [Anaerolineales bacterium]
MRSSKLLPFVLTLIFILTACTEVSTEIEGTLTSEVRANISVTPTASAISPTLTATTTPTPDTTAVAEGSYQATPNINKTQNAAAFATIVAMKTATRQARPPTSTSTPTVSTEIPLTGMEELDRVVQIGLDGDIEALRSLFRYVQAQCTNDDGLGGSPKCKEGEVEGETVEVLPVLAGEGHFIRKDDIDSWIGVDASDLYAVYSVSDSAFSDPIYPSGEYAIAFINEARFMISTLHIVEGQIVRVDYTMGNPPTIRPDDVDMYLIAPRELDQ